MDGEPPSEGEALKRGGQGCSGAAQGAGTHTSPAPSCALASDPPGLLGRPCCPGQEAAPPAGREAGLPRAEPGLLGPPLTRMSFPT